MTDAPILFLEIQKTIDGLKLNKLPGAGGF